jgi:hypothetical protein
MNAAINTQSAKALKSAYFCYFLAGLVMLTTCWFIWQGIEATEPDSPARSSKIVSGVLLVFLEGCAFSLAGQWREYSLQLRLLGWAIFGLQIVTMTLSNYSVGSTASKAAAASKDTLAEYKAQASAARDAAKALQADANDMRKSKHSWKRDEAGKKSDEAAKQTAAAAGTAEKMERLQAATVSSPAIDKIGETWYLVLSCVWSAIFETSSIVLMSTAGGLRRKADVGALPVDLQILELLHKIHGGPAAPAQTAPAPALPVAPAQTPMTMQVQAAPVAPATAAPVQAATQAPFTFLGFKKVPAAPIGATPAPAPTVTSFKPEGTVAPAGFSFSSKTAMAGAGALAALTAAPMTQAAPAPVHEKAPAVPSVATANSALVSVHPGASVSVQSSAPQSAPHGASETVPTGASVSVQSGASVSVQSTAKKPRAKRAVSAKLDTGTDGKAGARFKRIKAGVVAGKIRPSIRGIQAVEGGSQDVVLDYLKQLETEGVIVRKGRGFALVQKVGAA